MARFQRVLIIDGLDETQQVLKAVFEPRGYRVDRVRGEHGPHDDEAADVVVLHESHPLRGCHREHAGTAPRVFVGNAHVPQTGASIRCIREPFRYDELVSAVEQLLGRAAA